MTEPIDKTPRPAQSPFGLPLGYRRITMDDTELTVTCIHCHKEQPPLQVKSADYFKYTRGYLIQDCFPSLTPELRELLVTGICPECWNKIF